MEVKNDCNKFDLLDLIANIWNNKKFIFTFCAVGALVGLLIFVSLPRTYVAKMSFAPEAEQKLGSGVSSIASMMGVSFDTSVDAISTEMYPYVVNSTPFVFDLFDLQVETKDSLRTDLLDYMKNHQKKPWWKHVMSFPSKAVGWVVKQFNDENDSLAVSRELDLTNLPGKERSVVKYFEKNLIIIIDKKTGRLDVSLEMQDPMVAATTLSAVVENLKEYMIDYRTTKEREDITNFEIICNNRKLDYYEAQAAYAEFADANKNLVRLNAQAEQLKLQQEMQLAYQVYSQVAAQLEAARIKEQQSKPVFVILEPVTIPIRPSGPGILAYMLLFAMLAGFAAATWVLFGRDLYAKIINKLQQ